MKIDDEFYIVLMNGKEICYGEYPGLGIFPTLGYANDLRVDLHFKFPNEEYAVKKK